MERKIVNDNLKITIKNLNPIKRPISAVADNIEVRNAKNIQIKTNQKLSLISYMTKIKAFKRKLKLNN